MKNSVLFVVLFLSLVLYIPCYAAESSELEQEANQSKEEEKPEVIDEAKRKAITELLEITEISARVKALNRAFLNNAKRTFRLTVIDDIKSSPELRKQDRQELRKLVIERTTKLSDKYNKLFSEQIDLDKIVRKIAFDIYAKYFSAEEINDIIAFYKTPTGIKARKVMPKLSRESMLATQELLKPKLKAIVDTVLEEDKQPEDKKAG